MNRFDELETGFDKDVYSQEDKVVRHYHVHEVVNDSSLRSEFGISNGSRVDLEYDRLSNKLGFYLLIAIVVDIFLLVIGSSVLFMYLDAFVAVLGVAALILIALLIFLIAYYKSGY